jgi:hypothetical protein
MFKLSRGRNWNFVLKWRHECYNPSASYSWWNWKIYISKQIALKECRGPGSIPGHYKKKVVGLERGPLSLMSTTEELLDRKVAAPV